MSTRYKTALTIAGSDCSGGAGIQADIKTFSALGCYGMSVITALTAQNTTGVSGIHPIPPAFAGEQLEAVFNDIHPDAVKIGMLYSAELIETVADKLSRHRAKNIVLDPVMVAQSGDTLLMEDAMDAMKSRLMPLASVVTPNLPEAEVLLGRKIVSEDGMGQAARELAGLGSGCVLIKGGHLEGIDSTDMLYMTSGGRLLRLSARRVLTRNNHGTGCTLSSAIAGFLARGLTLDKAVAGAKEYVTEAIKAGSEYRIGNGNGPVHHFYRLWQN